MSRWKRKLRCKRGHKRTPENLYSNWGCKKCVLAAARKWEKANKHRRKEIDIKNEHGLSLVEFHKRRQKQKNRCAVCKKKFKDTPRVDHDHTTKLIRGLLCHHCNCLLGFAKDNITTLLAAVKYLRDFV